MAFAILWKLKNHVKTVHEGRKDYKCSQCDKFFSQQGNLKAHIKTIHEGVKDFRCDICGDAFGYSYELKKHTKTFHEDEIIKTENSNCEMYANIENNEEKY